MTSPSIRILMLLLCSSLTACGGGSGGDTPGGNTPGGDPPGGSANRVPVADAGADVTVDEGRGFTLLGAGSDADGDQLEFEWSVPEGFAVSAADSAELVVSATPDVSEDASFTFTLKATDAMGASASDEVVVTLRELPHLAVSIAGIKTLEFNWTVIEGADHYRLYGNPDGTTGFTQVGEAGATVTSHVLDVPVHLLDWSDALYLLEACMDTACANKRTGNTVTVANMLAVHAIGYIKASNTETEDHFGTALALSGDGNLLVVGAPNEDGGGTGVNPEDIVDSSTLNSGAVYLFGRDVETRRWSRMAYIKPHQFGGTQEFGASVALSETGTVLAVGAPGDDSGNGGINADPDNVDGAQSGAAYIYRRLGDGSWALDAYIKRLFPSISDQFGAALGLNDAGDVLVVGSPGDDSASGEQDDCDDESPVNCADGSGSASVFTWTESEGWQQTAFIKAMEPGSGDAFGSRVAVSGDGMTFAASAPGDDGENEESLDDGAVHVFRFDGTWARDAYLVASNRDVLVKAKFADSLALNGDGTVLAASTVRDNVDSTGVNGDQTATSSSTPFVGAVHVFRRGNEQWEHQAYVKPASVEAAMQFGFDVDLNRAGDILAVGSIGEGGGAIGVENSENIPDIPLSGAVYVFRHDATGWQQSNYVKASNTQVDARFGSALSLSAVGESLAVSAPREDSAATDINGEQLSDCGAEPRVNCERNSGAAYVY